MNWRYVKGLALLLWPCAYCQTPDVGTGAPTQGTYYAYINAYYRNGFSQLVGAPNGNVAKLGSTGLIQTFPAAKGSGTFALIKPDLSDTPNVAQVLSTMYAYYNTFTYVTAGYPTSDTLTCPPIVSPGNTSNSCLFQTFGSGYVLFVYASPVLFSSGQTFATRAPFLAKWTVTGGMATLGPAFSAETQFTSPYGSVTTFQSFDQGAIFNITSGVLSGRILAVKGAIYRLYLASGGQTGSLGLPSTDELALSNGLVQQTFERGAIQLDPSTGVAVLRPPVDSLSLVPSGQLHMNAGDSLQVQATVYAGGASITDRTVAWTSSNGRVVQVQPNGLTATLKAVGSGTAAITVAAEGKTSPALTVTVTAPCCQIGEGAPSAAIQQAFQDAVARNNLIVQLPAGTGAVRAGNGYIQQLVSAGTPPIAYLVSDADGSGIAYVVTGPLLTQYLVLGGPVGTLGYPTGDATAGGRQIFQQGALAGSPVQLVNGVILSKWAALGYETGVAGSPVAAPTAFITYRGSSGSTQAFQNGLIIGNTGGGNAGQAFFVTGPVLAKYTASGGPTGDLGSPTDDEHAVNGLRQQDFEGGYIYYAAGTSTATVVINPRQPLVTATPGAVLSGSAVHLSIGGFSNGATVRVSQTGQADFLVQVASGSYGWDVFVPASAVSGTVTVRAVDVKTNAAAQSTYTYRNAASSTLTLSIADGDGQTGAPGSQLTQPLTVTLSDQNGTRLAGQSVTFTASPGAQVSLENVVTDANGQASTMLRLPLSAGLALATAQFSKQVVTFTARAAAVSLSNFPALSQSVDGALVTAVASILRYHQLRNELPQPNGLADPSALNQFLKAFCVADLQGQQICDGFVSGGIVNLWRVGAFVGNNIDVRIEPTSLESIRDLVAGGSPVLLALSLTGVGSHFVVATGIAADGSLLIADPALAQTTLNGYLNSGSITGAVRLIPGAMSGAAFVINGNALSAIASAQGACGQTLQFPESSGTASIYFQACDGSSGGPYQWDIAATGAYTETFTDLGTPGGRTVITQSGPGSFAINRTGAAWTLASLVASIASGGVVNAASFTDDLAPGEIVSIFGTGFLRSGQSTTVQVNGKSAPVLVATAFQVNAQIPIDILPGAATLNVNSGNGIAQQTVSLSAVAPAIFSIGAAQAAITNQDNRLNATSNPATRGSTIVIYCTGLGAVTTAGKLNPAAAPVTVVIGGTEIPAVFAGLTPGIAGLYQVNVALPSTLPPGLSLSLYLKQAVAKSNIVTVAVQ